MAKQVEKPKVGKVSRQKAANRVVAELKRGSTTTLQRLIGYRGGGERHWYCCPTVPVQWRWQPSLQWIERQVHHAVISHFPPVAQPRRFLSGARDVLPTYR